MKKSEVQNKFVTGPIGKSLLALMIPIVIGNLLQTMYNLTDTFWVGRLGKEAVAAVSLSFPIIFLIISLASGIGMAGSILVSQYKGRKNHEMMTEVSSQTLLLAFVFAIVFSTIGYLFTPQIIALFGAEAAVLPLAISYLRYSMIGIVFVFGYTVFQSVLQGAGDAKTPFYIVLMTVLLNLILDPLLIFGWKNIPAFGVSGAAVSTLLTQAIALLIGMIILFKGKEGIKLKWKHLKPKFSLIKKIFKIGLPTSLEQSGRSLEMIFMTMIVAVFGTVTLAGFGIGMRIFGFIIIPALSLTISTSILVGQNIGAKQFIRAKKIPKFSIKIGSLSLLLVSAIVIIFAKQIAGIFIPGEDEVIRITSQYLRITAITYPLIGIQMSILGALKGAGRTGLSMRIAMIGLFIQIATAVLLSQFTPLGIVGVWIAYPIAQIIVTTISLYTFFKIDWTKKNLV